MHTAAIQSMPPRPQMLSSATGNEQGLTHPFVMHIGLPAASIYCATTVASCLSKQFLTETVAFPVAAAPAPLLQTHAGPLVEGQATWLLFLAGALVHVQPAVLACGVSDAQVAALAPVRAKQVVIECKSLQGSLRCRVSHATSPQRHHRPYADSLEAAVMASNLPGRAAIRSTSNASNATATTRWAVAHAAAALHGRRVRAQDQLLPVRFSACDLHTSKYSADSTTAGANRRMAV
jgi:hypothetical protein